MSIYPVTLINIVKSRLRPTSIYPVNLINLRRQKPTFNGQMSLIGYMLFVVNELRPPSHKQSPP